MKMITTRIVVYAKDIMKITGRCERTARKIIADIRRAYDKHANAYITVDDFCRFMKFREAEVLAYLK